MKTKASAVRKIAAFRMSPYTRRSIRSQLYCLALTLALLALPLAGIVRERAPILTPLATELVPLGTSLQLPPTNPFHLPSLEAPARLVLGPSPSPDFALNPDSDGRLQNVTSLGFSDSGAIDGPNVRAPPSN
jgi:hypothetical protein